jgi:hypothetical protein
MSSLDDFMVEWNTRPSGTPLNKRARLFDNVLEIEVSVSGRPNTLRINSIRSLKLKSGKVSQFLNWITKRADKGKFTLRLAAQPFGWNKDELPQAGKLKEIVERFGFKVEYEYPDNGYEMIRGVK